jgi:hypothetical protein
MYTIAIEYPKEKSAQTTKMWNVNFLKYLEMKISKKGQKM